MKNIIEQVKLNMNNCKVWAWLWIGKFSIIKESFLKFID